MAATATPETKKPKVCLVCLQESEHLKLVGECHHAFCEPCIQNHLQERNGELTFPCPSCHGDCMIPTGAVGTLPDFVPTETEDTIADATLETTSSLSDDVKHVTRKVEVEEAAESVPQKDCTICATKDVASCAKKYCEDCDVYLCKECSDAHGKKIGTKRHVLTAAGAATRSSAGICRQHNDRPLKMYCNPCAVPCCCLCVESKHGDHDVCLIKNVLDAGIARLEKVIELGKSKLNDLGITESVAFSVRKAKLEWKETVIRTVEEKAEKCVNNILRQKEELLKTIREDCETSSEEECLRGVARIRGDISAKIEEGQHLLDNANANPENLKRLSEMEVKLEKETQSDLNTVPKMTADTNRPVSFLEESEPVRSIGSMSKTPLLRANKLHDLQMPTDMEFTSIPEICCLGELGYAAICRKNVELPDQTVQYIDQLVIFDKDGKVKNVEKDLPKVCGMDVDVQDRVVLLLPCKTDGMFFFRLYDPEKDNTESSKEFPLKKPLSLAMTPEGWCYVLCQREGDTRIITVVDMEGNVTQISPIASPGIGDHCRIACSSKYVYTMGLSKIAVCGMVEGKMTFLRAVEMNNSMVSLTVNWFGDILYAKYSHTMYRGHRSITYTVCRLQVETQGSKQICGIDPDIRLIHVNNHTLIGQRDKAIRVYELKC
ncbi:RING finger protein 207-like [Lineus longissimus]|uniref:RING finger protein 207-like n=1 Tax=Lineus longissimus TaxID=88925 RepID=UPI00315DB049